jgi:predicted helicase
MEEKIIHMHVPMKLNELNKNGRIYPREVWEKALEEYNKKENKLVTLGFNDDTTTDLSRVIGEVEKITTNEKGDWIAKVKVLDTPAAKEFEKQMAEQEMVCASCGCGSLTRIDDLVSGKVVDIVEEDYTLISLAIIPKKDSANTDGE